MLNHVIYIYIDPAILLATLRQVLTVCYGKSQPLLTGISIYKQALFRS